MKNNKVKCETCGDLREIFRMLDKPFYFEPFNICKDLERVSCLDCTDRQPMDEEIKSIVKNRALNGITDQL